MLDGSPNSPLLQRRLGIGNLQRSNSLNQSIVPRSAKSIHAAELLRKTSIKE